MQALPHKLTLTKTQTSSNTFAGAPQHDVLVKFPEVSFSGARSIGRIKLWNLPAYLWCSIIGTCLSTEELRKFVVRCTGLNFKQFNDLVIHEEGVQLAAHAEPGGKMLHKALDQRYSSLIKRFDRAKTAPEVAALWEEAKHSGEIPGAYWALLSHRAATIDLRQLAFGDVHMLSHLVGAANRADIRRLTSLAAQNADLECKIKKQEARLRDMVVSRDETINRLQAQLAERLAQIESPLLAIAAPEAGEIQTLRELVASLQHRLATDASRREQVELRAESATSALALAEIALRSAQEHEQAMQSELDGAERQLAAMARHEDEATESFQAVVESRTIVYVGGRPGPVFAMRNVVERANGDFVHHDGGLEDRRGLLASAVSKADVVLFPVDCISHDAVLNLKRLCRQAGKPYHALRTAGIASFVTALITGPRQFEGSLKTDVAPPTRTLAPHFCLRHG